MARGTLKHQFFGNFLAFSESLHYLGPEKPLGARKSPKVAKWATLICCSTLFSIVLIAAAVHNTWGEDGYEK